MRKIICALLLFFASYCYTDSKEVFTLLSINDVYEVSAKDGIGGLAELAQMLKEEKAKVPNAIVTVNGDFISPSSLATHYKGTHMIDIFNRIGVNLVVFGNHEFDFGAGVLKNCMDLSEFTWLGSNVYESNGKERFHSSKELFVTQVGDIKVGFFGVCTPETRVLSRGGDQVYFKDEIASAKEAIEELKKQDVDVFVGLTHLTIAQDEALAKALPEIDLILGGHEHIPMTKKVGKTLIHKSGFDAHYLVRMDLHISKKIDESGNTLVRVIPEWAMKANLSDKKDPSLMAVIDQYQSTLDTELSQALCVSQTPMCSDSHCLRSGETAIGNMIADAIRDSFDVQAVLLNSGTIRGGCHYEAGQAISRKDVITELPFTNGCKALQMSGAKLLDALEFGVSCGKDMKGGFPQISGIKLEYNPKLPIGRQVVKVLINGQPIEPSKNYRIAVTDYMAQGGDGYTMLKGLKETKGQESENILYSIVSQYLEKQTEVAPAIEGRIKVSAADAMTAFN